MGKIFENFYLGYLFTLDSYGCYCTVDNETIAPGEQVSKFRVFADENKPIRFAFEAGTGLVRVSLDKGQNEESNILSSFLAIDDTDIEGYKKFFERNGFLFPVPFNEFVDLKEDDLLILIDRMRTTVKIMMQISEIERKDYKKLIAYNLSLIMAAPRTLQVGGTAYTLCEHKKVQDAFAFSRDFDKTRHITVDSNNEFAVKDDIFKGYKINLDWYQHLMKTLGLTASFEKSILHAYVNGEDAPSDLRRIIEWLFHIYFDIGIVEQLCGDTLVFQNGTSPDWSKLTPELKAATLDVAKILAGEEINSNVDGVRPVYDISIMEPRWRVDSLLSAMYFSIFYMKPNVEITRQCANPKCNNFFVVSKTSLKKKYCCTECGNRANQNNYRLRHKGEK